MEHIKVKSIFVCNGIFIDLFNVQFGGYYVKMRDSLMHHDIMLWQCEFSEIIRMLKNMLDPDIMHPQRNRFTEHSYSIKLAPFSENFIIFDERDGSQYRLERNVAYRLIHLYDCRFECDWCIYQHHNCCNILAEEINKSHNISE